MMFPVKLCSSPKASANENISFVKVVTEQVGFVRKVKTSLGDGNTFLDF